ncbi:MAG: ParB/RepB/Spo0J family partition protein [Hamadaea sp.]|nr:ParB/RepB/Spo0J family partition protein [Hamadaea sp.]
MTLGHIPTDQIQAHPHNPRRQAVADEEMVDSIRSLGILTAVTVAPALDGDGFTMIGGHCRLDGAIKAGLTQVPAVIRDDLVTEAQQLEAMLVENLARRDLTPVEEAEAYEQLQFQGMDVAAIAAATGRKASTIKSRLKLTGLGDTTRERLHAGEMTLLDAEAMLEFADDAEATAELEEFIGTPSFAQRVHLVRSRRERLAAHAQRVADLQAAGAVEVHTVPGGAWKVYTKPGEELTARSLYVFTEDLRDASAHSGCLGYVLPEPNYVWGEIRLMCIDPARHPQPEAPAQPAHVESDWEKRQAERAEKAARHAAAMSARIEWLRSHFAGLFPVKGNGLFLAAAKAFLPLLIIDDREAMNSQTLLTALGIDHDTDAAWQQQRSVQETYAATVANGNPAKVAEAFAGYLAAVVADQLDGEDPEYVDDLGYVEHVLAVWDWMKKAGYQLSDVDKADRTALEVELTINPQKVGDYETPRIDVTDQIGTKKPTKTVLPSTFFLTDDGNPVRRDPNQDEFEALREVPSTPTAVDTAADRKAN